MTGGDSASSRFLDMNSISTSQSLGGNIGRYAFAGSLILHAGLIVFVSAWQWDWTAPEKNRPKIVHVKFIPASPSSQPSEHQVASRSVSGSPAQPRENPLTAVTPLKARTPYARIPAPHSLKKVHRMATPHKIIRQRPLTQRASLIHQATRALPAHPFKISPVSHGSAERVEVRPAPSFTGQSMNSTQAVAAVYSPSSSRQNHIQKISPTTKARFSNVRDGITPTAQVRESTVAKIAHLKPRPHPASFESPPLSAAAFVPEAVIKGSLLRKAQSPLQASLSWDRVDSDPAVDEPAGEDLDLLRGTFTGKVRQRIATAKHYPRIARRRGMEGRPVIVFTLDKQGHLEKVDLARTSGYQVLDRAALEAVHNGAPYPEIPAPLKMDSFQFKLPISFVLK